MRWPWQKKPQRIDPTTQALIDEFRGGLDEIRTVAGDLRQTNRDLRLQMGEEQVTSGRSREKRPRPRDGSGSGD